MEEESHKKEEKEMSGVSDGFIALFGMGFLAGIITTMIMAVFWNDDRDTERDRKEHRD